MQKWAISLLATVLLMSACGSAGDFVEVTTADDIAPVVESTVGPVEADQSVVEAAVFPLTFYVSNQSFSEPAVAVTVTIDGDLVVDQEFEVGNQHGWIEFEYSLPAGEHLLEATSSTGAQFSVTFSTVENQSTWAVVDYWTVSDENPDSFIFSVSDTPIRFS